MRRRLYLMRHAEVRYVGERDIEAVRLTERGREQAEAARRALDDVHFNVVLTSGLPRTVETAEVVAPNREHERWPDFQEWRAGRLSEIPPEELEQEREVRAAALADPPRAHRPGAEAVLVEERLDAVEHEQRRRGLTGGLDDVHGAMLRRG